MQKIDKLKQTIITENINNLKRESHEEVIESRFDQNKSNKNRFIL